MFRFRTNHALRITTALAVLLLLAVQEKLCPWLSEDCDAAEAEAQAKSQPRPATPSGPDEDNSNDAPPPLSLASVLPDAVPPRSPAGAGGVRLATAKRKPSTALRDDEPDPSEAVSSAVSPSAVANSILTIPFPPALEACLPHAQAGVPPPRDPSLDTVISKTGPPAC